MKNYYWLIFVFLIVIMNVEAFDNSSLIEYWDFENTIDGTILGQRGQALNTVGGYPNGQSISGHVGSALNLITNVSYYSPLDLSDYSNLTINFWVRFDNTKNAYIFQIANHFNPILTTTQFNFKFTNTSQLGSFGKTYDSTSESDANILIINNSNYNMYTLVWKNNTNISYYVNGVLNKTVTSATLEIMPKGADYFRLGIISTSVLYQNYSIDDLMIFSKLLNQTEITELLNVTVNVTQPNVTIIQYACMNSTNNGLGTVNLCQGLFYDYSNGTEDYCHYYGIPSISNNCTFGCVYTEANGGFCINSNTTLNYNTTLSIGTYNFSKNQCMVASSKDFVCNNTLIDSEDLGVYCEEGDMIACPTDSKYCLTFVTNSNDSTIEYFNNEQLCSVINQDRLTGINLLCTVEWVTSPTIVALLSTIGLSDCTLGTYTKIPFSSCKEGYLSIKEYKNQHIGDYLYFEGQCSPYPTINTCNVGETATCANNLQIRRCVQYPDGSYKYNLTTCGYGQVCSSGSCTVAEVIPEGEGGGLFDGFSTKTKYWIMLIITLFVFVGFTILVATFGDGMAGVMVGLVLSMLTSLVLTIVFNLSILIPILYIIIGGSIVTVIMRKIFMGGM